MLAGPSSTVRSLGSGTRSLNVRTPYYGVCTTVSTLLNEKKYFKAKAKFCARFVERNFLLVNSITIYNFTSCPKIKILPIGFMTVLHRSRVWTCRRMPKWPILTGVVNLSKDSNLPPNFFHAFVMVGTKGCQGRCVPYVLSKTFRY